MRRECFVHRRPKPLHGKPQAKPVEDKSEGQQRYYLLGFVFDQASSKVLGILEDKNTHKLSKVDIDFIQMME